MTRLAVLCLTWPAMVSCNPTANEKAQLDELVKEKAAVTQEKVDLTVAASNLRAETATLSGTRDTLRSEIDRLQQDEGVLRAEKEKRGVHYVLHCSIRQIHYSLSIKKQIADAVNEDNFDLVTDKDSYDRAAVGSNLFDSFRAGSAIFKGSLGSWRIKVESKNVVVDP